MWLSALALPARLTSCLCLCGSVCRTRLEEASTAFQYFVNPTLAAQVHACTPHHIITTLHFTYHFGEKTTTSPYTYPSARDHMASELSLARVVRWI